MNKSMLLYLLNEEDWWEEENDDDSDGVNADDKDGSCVMGVDVDSNSDGVDDESVFCLCGREE